MASIFNSRIVHMHRIVFAYEKCEDYCYCQYNSDRLACMQSADVGVGSACCNIRILAATLTDV